MSKLFLRSLYLMLLTLCLPSMASAETVAKIGSTQYATLQEAFDAVADGQTITLTANITQDDGFMFNRAGVSAKLDLSNKTLTVNKGSNVNSRAIRIDNGTLEVYRGTIKAVGSGTTSSDGTGCYGAFRVEANGKLVAHDLTLSNARPWGLNVKVLGGEAELTNVTINSSYGGGIEVTEADLGTQSKKGKATLTNCTFTQTGYFDHCSTTLSVSGGSELVVNSGSYTSENYVIYVFSSGGDVTVNGGDFTATGDKAAFKAAIDTNTYPEYTGGMKLNDGNFVGKFEITSPASTVVTGGIYTADVTAYMPTGATSAQNTDGSYTINPVAVVNGINYSTLADAIAAVPTDGTATTITIIANQTINVVGYAITIPATKNVVLDLNGFQVVGTVEQEGTSALIRNLGTLTIMDSSDTEKDGTGTGKLMSGADPTWTWDGTDDYSGSYASNLIRNEKNLTVESGLLYNMSTGSASYAIDNYSAGNVTINGGKVDAAKASAIRLFYINGGSITVTDGVIGHYTSDTDRSFMGVQVMSGTNANVSIKGGTLAGKNAFYASNSGGTMSITGGTFNGAVGSSNITGFISNGTFSEPVNPSLCASGKKCVEDGDGYIIVDDSDPREPAGEFVYYYWYNSNNEEEGETCAFSTPFTSNWLCDGEFITLLNDITLTEDIACQLASGSFTLTQGTHSITKGNYSVTLLPGVSVVTDKQTDIFTAPTTITETVNNGVYTYTAAPYVAQIGTTKYATLEAAFAAAQDGDEITLLADCAGNGIKVPQGKFTTGLTVDFGGFTYTVDGETVGSTGTETNGFQLLKDNNITFKNGTITSTKAKILVQNYSNLTLDNMVLTLNNTSYNGAYTLSNNNGNVVIDNNTTINANPAGAFAFDVCRYSSYPSVSVEVKGSSVINGNVEISASKSDAKDGFGLKLTSGTLNGDIVVDASAKAAMESTPEKATVTKADAFEQAAPEGYKWKDNGDGTSKLVVDEFILRDGTDYTKTADEQVAKATYIRSFGSDRVKKYQGWFIPFDYTITAADLQKFKFFKIDMIAHSAVPGEAGDPNKLWVHLIQLTENDVMKANMPYIFTPQEEAQNYEFTTTNATLKALTTQSVASCSTTSEEFNFYGVYSPIHPVAEDTDIFYYMALSGQLSYATKTSTTVGANRWIFRVTPKSGQESKVAYSIGFVVNGEVEDDDVTAVSSAAAEAEGEVVGYYTLNGQKVSEPTKGVYVVKYANGTSKKVVF